MLLCSSNAKLKKHTKCFLINHLHLYYWGELCKFLCIKIFGRFFLFVCVNSKRCNNVWYTSRTTTTFVLPCPFLLFVLCLLSQGSSNPPAWHRALAGGDGWEQAQATTFKPSVSACTLRSRACTGLAACPMCTAYGHGCSGRHLKEIASALCFSTPACLTLHPYTLLALSSVLNFSVSAVGLCVSSRRRCLAMELPCDIFLWESLWKLFMQWKKRMLKSSVALRDCTCSGHIFTLDHP